MNIFFFFPSSSHYGVHLARFIWAQLFLITFHSFYPFRNTIFLIALRGPHEGIETRLIKVIGRALELGRYGMLVRNPMAWGLVQRPNTIFLLYFVYNPTWYAILLHIRRLHLGQNLPIEPHQVSLVFDSSIQLVALSKKVMMKHKHDFDNNLISNLYT